MGKGDRGQLNTGFPIARDNLDNKYGRVVKTLHRTLFSSSREGVFRAHGTCGGDVRAAAHLQQFERVAVVGHQDLQRRVVHRSVVDLQRGQRFGVDKHHGQGRDEVGLRKRENEASQSSG